MWPDWERLGELGITLMENLVSLVGLSLLVTGFCIGLVGKPYQSLFGPVGFNCPSRLKSRFTLSQSIASAPGASAL